MSESTVPARLVRFGQLVNSGLADREAARQAGYKPSYVDVHMDNILARARRAGLIVDPESVRADAAAITSEAHSAATLFGAGVQAAASTIVDIAAGKQPASNDQLKAAVYIVNQVIGAPRQATDITTGGQALVQWRTVTINVPAAATGDDASPVA